MGARADAKAAGLTRYFTGAPCPKGHVSERFVSGGQCVECTMARSRDWHDRNRDYVKAKSKMWAANNRDYDLERRRTYRANNLEAERARKRADYHANFDKRSASAKAWRAANVQRVRDVMAAWRQANRDAIKRYSQLYAPRKSARAKARSARVANATPGWLTSDDITAMARIYLAAMRISEVTGIPHEVDHVIPLQGEMVCGLHLPSNLRIITRADNRSKWSKYVQ